MLLQVHFSFPSHNLNQVFRIEYNLTSALFIQICNLLQVYLYRTGAENDLERFFRAVQSFDLLLSKTLQEIASSVHFLLNVSLVTLQCHPSHKTICLRATRKLGWKARQTWLENISRRKLYSRKGLISLKVQNGTSCVY